MDTVPSPGKDGSSTGCRHPFPVWFRSHRFLCGHRIGHHALLPGIVVQQPQASGLGSRRCLGVHHAAAEDLAGLQPIQQLGQGHLLPAQRGVQNLPAPGHRQGEDHAVGQRQPRAQGLRHQALAFQRGNVDGVSVLPEQPCQRPLAQITAHDPEIPFSIHPVHWNCLLPSGASYASGEERVRNQRWPLPKGSGHANNGWHPAFSPHPAGR